MSEKNEQHREEKQVALNVRSLSPNIRRRLKIMCAERGVSMESAVISLIEDFICGDVKLSIGPSS